MRIYLKKSSFNYDINKKLEEKSFEIKDESDFDKIESDDIIYCSLIEDGSPVYDFKNPLILSLLEKFSTHKIVGVIEKEEEDVLINLIQAKAFLGVADSLKILSKCTRLKVCCVIEKDGRIISTGVNGTPAGFINCEKYFSVADRLKPDFYKRHHEFSENYEIHAEMNAVLELGRNTSIDSYQDLSLYCSTCPCPGCAKMIAQSGIKNVFYHEEYDRLPEGAQHLKEFNINVFKL